MANGQALTTGPDARLTLTTLGGASLAFALDDAPPVTLLGPGKPLALITYLAFSPRRSASREHLVGVLWADSEPERAHHALRQTVWQIRHSVGDRVVVTRNGDLALGREIATDRDAFLAAVEAGDHQCAVALYAGEFLPDFAAPGGAGFEQWADLERIRLRTAFLRCAESLARRHLSQGHVRHAQRIARRARDADPLNESGWRLLLETLAAGNDWTQSAMEADALERLLEAEEREPEPATRAAIRRARQAPADADGGSRQALVAELVGREKEFAAVLTAWDDAKRGAARHVHVTGPAGLGKTRLLHDTLARLRAAGARACYARANPGERGIPFAAAAEVAAQLAALPGAAGVPGGIAAALVALNPSLSARYPAVTPERRGGDKLLHRTVALTELLAAVADEGPVAVLLDDLHWADAESRQVLAGLAARLASHRVLLVTAARPTAERIFETAPATLRLPPLDERQVALFVTSIAALPDEPWARDLAARLTWATGGSPLLLIESLQLALERDTLALAGDSWTCPDPAALAGTLGAGSALRRRLEELDPDARWLVLTLAAAGTPVATTTLARAADRPEEILLPALGALEERGLVSRAGQAWEPAHDELAALALEAVTPETLREVLGALGSALVAELPADPEVAKRAAPLLAAAGDTRGLAAVLRGWIAAARARGDHRAPAALASEILRERANAPHVRAAVAALPLRIRLGFDSTTRRAATAAAAAVMVLLALGAWAASGAGIPPDAVVYVVTGGDAAKEVRRVELRAEGWRGGEPLPPGDDVGALPWQAAWPARWHEGTPVPSPSGRQWAGHFTVSDSGGQDLHMSGPDGALRRLTWSSGDDGTPAWAPDESALAFATARWNPLSHYDVAVLDLGTGAVRQLTRGDDSDYEPHWSPDGSRIAFVRRYHDGRPAAACWVAVDASRTACVPLRGPATGTGMLGWRDERRVVVQGDSAGVPVHRVVDLETGSVAPLDIPEAAAVSLDPTGAWVLIRGIVPGTPQAAWYVAPLDQLSRVRRLTERLGDAQAFWGWAPHESHWVETLRIEPPAGSVPSDGAHRLLAEGRDRHGHVVPLHTLAWRSSDTTIATIDSDGIVRPRRTGTVTIHASAGGWRSGSQRITIGPPGFTTLISERWGGGLETEWVAYGEPRPLVVSTSDGRHALWSRGDSSFASGVYSRRTFTAAGGLGAEMEVSLSLTALQWQIQALVLDASLDTAMLARWDHRTGSIPRRAATHQPACAMMFPGNEGLDGVKALQMSNSQMESRRPEAPADLRNGTPHRFRVQILPDGRCGFALDGKPLWVTRGALPLDRPIRIVLEGKSHGTRVLVGPLEVWRGVKGDVDWRLLEEGRGEKDAPGR